MPVSFVHLRLHTEYSLVDGIVRIKPLVKAARAAGMPAVAVTDQCNLFAMVKFYKAAIAAGIKPIIGVDLWLENPNDPNQPYRLTLLCQNNQGYLNLSELVSRTYTEGQHGGVPVLKRDWLEGLTEGLIALSGGREGDVGQALLAGHADTAAAALADWQRLFPDRFYLELQRTGREHEEDYLHAAVALATDQGVPVVATNDVRFIQADGFEAHEARVCIHDGRTLDDPRRPRLYSDQQYLKSPEEMAELFADIPEALDNTVEIARRCNLELTLGENFLPEFPVPEGMTMEAFFNQQAHAGLEQRLDKLFDRNSPEFAEQRRPYDERLQIELDVINQMGFPGYFLIVADFIQWAKANGVPVGPGRGSGAGSLVAYALTITDLDPIAYDLLFERFLNPERVSMPDFDVDFCMEGRDRVIDYVARRYGREKVSQIITYGSMAAKAVVRDVGRVLGHPYGFVDRIAKLIPFEIGMTLDRALEQEEELKRLVDEDEEVRGIIELAQSLEGLARNAGKHAGGVVISPTKLTDFTPLYCEHGSESIVSQFDKDDVEAVGLVKFDFLGLRTLTIIDWALRSVNAIRREAGEPDVDIETIPLDDPDSFRLLKACKTTAVFQLESSGMKDLIRRLQPDSFEDIIALVALFRPGPLQSGMVDDFIARKHGRQRVEYPHPKLEPILAPTYGVILYQEQVMQIAQVLAGYTLGGADLLRRAMGKKKPEEMAKQRVIFTEGATVNGVDEKTATYIFDLMEKFAGYGFNKSHSAAYALVSYQTTWLKAHYPAAFMAAVLSADMDNTDKVVTLIDECRDMKLGVIPPNVNRSMYRFTAEGVETVIYGLGAIKGVGQGAIEAMLAEREANGPFADLFDFCRRVDLRKLNRRVLEALIRAGALDEIGSNRATLMARLPMALKLAEQHVRDADLGQNDLFGEAGPAPVDKPLDLIELPEWTEDERLTGEKETLGLYLSGHPICRYEAELAHITSGRIAEVVPDAVPAEGGSGRGQERTVTLAGLVIALRVRNTRRGRMAFATLDDRSARIEMRVFSETFEAHRNLLARDRVLVIRGSLALDDYSGGYQLTADEIYDISQARAAFARRLVIDVDAARAGNGFMQHLAETLQPYREGRCPVWLNYHNDQARAQIMLGNEWRVQPADELLHRLGELAGGEGRVQVEYNTH
ncbi:DNA polymerase III subunit alpha [Thiohalobacter thiocyanaticus]|uniref:DNA polymerase III subunit alpha n=1 Tax=Thiohalobacter thiocyanaticus TaxID=585455 RepID=A0A426QE45_9GAMM|nr:DNA polymerase III subunit alpha [Thiohalobacter thiocyanaticus]RRQ20042.1 DNA polymerase III subunit alpha [Thiohalobacter thiocyanaticus]